MRHVEIRFTGICMYRFFYRLFHCNSSWRSTRPCYHSNNVWSVIVVHGEKTDDPAGCITRSDQDLNESCFFHNSSFHLDLDSINLC